MKNQPLQICNATIEPGEYLTLALPIPELYTCAPMYIPIHVMHGKKPGPCLLVCAAIYGDELNGIEIIQRLLSKANALKRLKGTLITIPVINVYGLINRSRLLPDSRDLNENFPGSETGSLAARLAHIFTTEILTKATHCIELHSGQINRYYFPQIQANLHKPGVTEMAKAFPVPVIIDTSGTQKQGSLYQTAQDNEIPIVAYTAGEALRFDESAIRIGLKGIINIMREIDMLRKPSRKRIKHMEPLVSRYSTWIKSPKSGINQALKKIGDQIKESDCLAVIIDPFGSKQEYKVLAPQSGIIIGVNDLPLVNEGDPLFQIATFEPQELA
jgi:predicted deacylase